MNEAIGEPGVSTGGDGYMYVYVDTPQGRVSVKALPFAEARRLAELAVHRNDLVHAGLAVATIQKTYRGEVLAEETEPNRVGLNAMLLQSAVMSYCRCFDPHGKEGHQLRVGDYLAGHPLALEAHEQVWGLRHKHYGHDINGFRDAKAGAARINGGAQLVQPFFNMTANPDVVANLGRLVRDALAFVDVQAEALERLLLDKVSAMPDDTFDKLPQLRFRVPTTDRLATKRRRS